MTNLVKWLNHTIQNFYHDELNDLFPVFNALHALLDENVELYVFRDDHSIVVYEFNNKPGIQCGFKSYQDHDIMSESYCLRTLLEDVLIDPETDYLNIIIGDTHILFDHDLIMNALKHVPTPNLSFFDEDSKLLVDHSVDSIEEAFNYKNQNVLLNVDGDIDFNSIASYLKSHHDDILNIYLLVNDCKHINQEWNHLLDVYDFYENKSLYKGAKLFRNKQYEDAFELFKQAADYHNYGALSNLGYCYEEGKGVDCNPELSHYYYSQAAKYYESYALMQLAVDDVVDLRLLYLAYAFAKESKEFYSYPDICFYIALYDDESPQRIQFIDEAIKHYRIAISNNHDYHEDLKEALALKQDLMR